MQLTDAPETMLVMIAELIQTKQYDWARPTLEGIADTIRRTGCVTLRQQEAVEHVMIGRLKHDVRE